MKTPIYYIFVLTLSAAMSCGVEETASHVSASNCFFNSDHFGEACRTKIGSMKNQAHLSPGQTIGSTDGKTAMKFEADGIYMSFKQDGFTLSFKEISWSGSGSQLVMQTDGNLVVYDASGRALWHTHTHDYPNAELRMQNDGNLVIYDVHGNWKWQTDTVMH